MFSSAPAALEAPNVSGHSPEQNSGAGGGASTPSGSPPSAPSAKGKLRLRAGAGGDTEEIDAPVDMQRGVDPDDSGGLAGGHVAPEAAAGGRGCATPSFRSSSTPGRCEAPARAN